MIKFVSCLYKAIFKTVNDEGVEYAGYMSFMVIMSFFPFLVFFLAFTSSIGISSVGEKFIELILNDFPENIAKPFKSQIYKLYKSPPPDILNIAIFGSIWTSSSFLESLKNILNKIYNVVPQNIYLYRRFISILQFFIFSILVSLWIFSLLIAPEILRNFPEIYDLIYKKSHITGFTRQIIVFFFLILTITSLYYFLPSTKIKIIEILPGTLITASLWYFSGKIMTIYLKYYTTLNFVYGSLGGIIIALTFFYMTNLFFIYGAAFNALYFKNKN